MRPLVVDGSNVGKVAGGGNGGPALLDLAVLREARAALRRQYPGAPIVTIVDRYEAIRDDVPAELRAAVASAIGTGELIAPPVNVTGGDDRFILSMGEQHGAVVVSNDRFREHVSEFPWLADGDRLLGADRSPLGWTFTPRRISPKARKRARARPDTPSAGTAASSDRPKGQPVQGAPARPAEAQPSKTEGAKSGGAKSRGVQPAGAKSGGAKSGGAKSGGVQPAGARSGGAKAAGVQPAGAKSGGAKSRGDQPAGAKPSGAKAAGVQPPRAKPRAAKTGAAKPGAAKPGAAKTGAAKPGPAKPGAAKLGGANPGSSPRAKAAADRPPRAATPRPARPAPALPLTPGPARPLTPTPALTLTPPSRPAATSGPSGAVYVAAALVAVAVGLFVVLRGDDPREERARAALASAMFAQTRGVDRVKLTDAEANRVLESMEDVEYIKGDSSEGRSDRACGRTVAWQFTTHESFYVCVLVEPDSGGQVGSFDLTDVEPLRGSNCIGRGVEEEVRCSER